MRTLQITLFLLTLAVPVFSQPAPEVPKLVPWTPATANTPGQFFVGAIYPETSAAGAVSFRLDATMTTPEGQNYYGVGLKLRTSRPATYTLVWQTTSGQAVNLVQLSSSCSSSAMEVLVADGAVLGLGKREGLRLTGRETVGASPGPATNLMNAGTPAFMYECGNDAIGPPFERRIHVLLPEQLFQLSGRLSITATLFPIPSAPQQQHTIVDVPRLLDLGCMVADCGPVQTTTSRPLILDFFREVPRVLVLGDSVAWGQGVLPAFKAGQLVATDMRDRYGLVKLTNRAHSGARIRIGTGTNISTVTASACLTGRGLNGEIPSRRPSVRCQIFDAVSSNCLVNAADIGVIPIPPMRCAPTLDQPPARPGEVIFNFDLGPAYDVVLVWACINDVDSFNVVAGVFPDISGQALRQRTENRCDLRNGLSDIREFLPNAKIVVNQYHLIVSPLTNFSRSNCRLREVPDILEDIGSALATDLGVALAASRSADFRNSSTRALRDSAEVLDQNIRGTPRRGRGRITFLEHPFFNPPGGAFWASNDPLVFPLVCTGQGVLAPIDLVQVQRVGACATNFGVSPVDPFRVAATDFMSCVRASGFHPNQRANRFMADAIIRTSVNTYPRMLNFNLQAPAMVNPDGALR